MVEGGLAHCSLGAIPLTRNSRPGTATILLRPDQIVLTPAAAAPADGRGRPGRVLSVVHAGPVARITLALAAGPPGHGQADTVSISFKAMGFNLPQEGCAVCVSVIGAAHPVSAEAELRQAAGFSRGPSRRA